MLYMPTTLSKAKSPYLITGDLLVPAASRLTIEAGVELQIAEKSTCADESKQRDWADSQFVSLKIEGAFYVKGTPEAPVSIHPVHPVPGKVSWDGIRISNQKSTSAKISFLDISGANRGLQVKMSEFTVENSFFVDNNIGIWLGEKANILVSNSLFSSNVSAGIYLEHAAPTLTTNIFVDNPTYGIWADSRKGLSVNNNLFWKNSEANCFHCPAEIGKRAAINAKGDSVDSHANLMSDPLFLGSAGATHKQQLDPNTPTPSNAVVDTNLQKLHTKADSIGKAGLAPHKTYVPQGVGTWRLSQYSPAIDAAPDDKAFLDANGTRGDIGPWGATAKYQRKVGE